MKRPLFVLIPLPVQFLIRTVDAKLSQKFCAYIQTSIIIDECIYLRRECIPAVPTSILTSFSFKICTHVARF
jgi:hypothetical protein